MSLVILFHFLCTQHVSEINISIIRSLRLCCWITTSVFCSRFVVCWRFGAAAPNLQRTTNREQKTDVVIQQHSRKLLMMDILISETCWVHKKWNKNAGDIKLAIYSSTVNNGMCSMESKKTTLLLTVGVMPSSPTRSIHLNLQKLFFSISGRKEEYFSWSKLIE